MGGKKGKIGRTGPKAKAANGREPLPNMYDVPEIPECPSKCMPIVTLNIKLANPVGFPMEFKLEVPVTTRVMAVHEKIVAQHGGAVRNLAISFQKHNPDNPAPLTASLIELGIYQSGEVNVYYDFTPISYPLLNI